MPPARELQFNNKTWATIGTIVCEIWCWVFSMIVCLKAINLDCTEKYAYRILATVGFVSATLSFSLMTIGYIFLLFAGNNPNARVLRTIWWIFGRPLIFYIVSAVAFAVMRFNVPQPSGCSIHLHNGTVHNSQVLTILTMTFCLLTVLIAGGLLLWLWLEERKSNGQDTQEYSQVEKADNKASTA